MKILLGNTGRGGEQCVFSAIVEAYKQYYPNAKISIAICPEFIKFWKNDKNISIIPIEHENPNKPYYLDPIGKWHNIIQNNKYDIIRFACEYETPKSDTILNNIIQKIDKIPITPKVYLTPSESDIELSESIKKEYGDDIIILSHISNSAYNAIPFEWYSTIAHELNRYYPVAITGRGYSEYCGKQIPPDKMIDGMINLIGQPILSLYAMSSWLKRFIGPDTATSWIVTNMPGKLMTLRFDEHYPLANTGLVNNGFRSQINTLEYNATNKSLDSILNACISYFTS